MSKAKIRAAVQDSIQFSDERDVICLARGEYDVVDRCWSRTSAFLSALAVNLAEIDAITAEQIRAFQFRIIKHQNPLRDAAVNMEQGK